MIKRPVVVIVDDDARVLESLGELVESAGYGVRTFNGAAAFLDSGHSDIDCLISDICMPGMDGFGILEVVRQARPELPVFLITARDDIADQERAAADREGLRTIVSKNETTTRETS